jgi:hypothetical protein
MRGGVGSLNSKKRVARRRMSQLCQADFAPASETSYKVGQKLDECVSKVSSAMTD